jgi:hypothetical protein
MQVVDLPTQPSVLSVLRGDPTTRPAVDRALAGGLRAWLEDGIYAISKGETRERPLVIRSNLAAVSELVSIEASSTAQLRGVLVSYVLRLASVQYCFDDPYHDALSAWRVEEGTSSLAKAFDQLSADDRARLAADVNAHASTLLQHLGVVQPQWNVRIHQQTLQRLSAGNVLLRDVVDLRLGSSATNRASVALFDITTSPLGDRMERTLRYHALVETLRTSTPPLRVATLSSATGEFWNIDVTSDLLVLALEDVLDAVEQRWDVA